MYTMWASLRTAVRTPARSTQAKHTSLCASIDVNAWKTQTNLRKSSSVVARGGARVRRDRKEGMEQGGRTLWGHGLLGVCVRIVQL